MKKKFIVPIIYFVIIATYIAVYLLSIVPKCTNNWIGFGFTLFSMILSMIIVMETDGPDSSSFPISISIAIFSFIYIVVSVLCNCLFGGINDLGLQITETRTFIIYEIICLALFVIILIILFTVRSHTKDTYDKTNYELDKISFVLNRIVLAKNKASELNNSDELLKKFDRIIEDIKSSNFSLTYDNGKNDYEIGSLIDRLDADLENIININSEDYTSIADTLSAIRSKIKERNVNISSKESHI